MPLSFTLQIAFIPAPSPVLDALQEIEVEASLDEASMFRLRFGLSRTALGDWTLLAEDLFRPLVPVTVRVQTGLGPPEVLINGYATHQEVRYGDGPGQATLEVTGMDATLLMSLVEKVMPWPNLPDSGIAAAIFGQYALMPRVDPTAPVLVEPEGTTTQRGSDIRFLRQLAARNGFHCYVQPEPISGVDQGYFGKPTPSPLPQAVVNVGAADQTNVSGFGVRYEMLKPRTVVAAGLDVATKAPQPGLAPAALELPMGIEGTLMRILPPPISRPADHGLSSAGSVQTWAQGLVDRSTWAVVARGSVGADVGVLRPGGTLNVRGAGRLHNGSYLVAKVLHAIGRDRYSQLFEARRNAVTMTGAELYVNL